MLAYFRRNSQQKASENIQGSVNEIYLYQWNEITGPV